MHACACAREVAHTRFEAGTPAGVLPPQQTCGQPTPLACCRRLPLNSAGRRGRPSAVGEQALRIRAPGGAGAVAAGWPPRCVRPSPAHCPNMLSCAAWRRKDRGGARGDDTSGRLPSCRHPRPDGPKLLGSPAVVRNLVGGTQNDAVFVYPRTLSQSLIQQSLGIQPFFFEDFETLSFGLVTPLETSIGWVRPRFANRNDKPVYRFRFGLPIMTEPNRYD